MPDIRLLDPAPLEKSLAFHMQSVVIARRSALVIYLPLNPSKARIRKEANMHIALSFNYRPSLQLVG
jgi:hypothetical protein